LSQALTAFTRAIRCHRRLARLAPRFFDATTVARAARDRAGQRRWMAIWEPALHKAYGHDPSADSTPDPDLELPPLPGVRTQRAVDRELAGLDFWMTAGRTAMDRHHQRRPHALPTLSQIARLLRVAFDLKQVAIGSAADDPPSESPDYKWVLAQINRSYSSPPDPAGGTARHRPKL